MKCSVLKRVLETLYRYYSTVKPQFTAGFGGRLKPTVNQGKSWFRFLGTKLAKKGGKGF